MGDGAPKGALEWALGYPDVIMACAKIGRLMNDLAGSSKVRTHLWAYILSVTIISGILLLAYSSIY